MKRLSFWLGLLSILYAGLYLLGFIPVSIWQYVLDLFIDRDPNTFYKIVPTESAGIQALVACLVGIVLIAFSKLPFKSSHNYE
jgi:hypothetical protein